jgi:hypothetical protein
MDRWKDWELRQMQVGGNAAFVDFMQRFAGISPSGAVDIVAKYATPAANIYAQRIRALARGEPWQDPTPSSILSTQTQQQIPSGYSAAPVAPTVRSSPAPASAHQPMHSDWRGRIQSVSGGNATNNAKRSSAWNLNVDANDDFYGVDRVVRTASTTLTGLAEQGSELARNASSKLSSWISQASSFLDGQNEPKRRASFRPYGGLADMHAASSFSEEVDQRQSLLSGIQHLPKGSGFEGFSNPHQLAVSSEPRAAVDPVETSASDGAFAGFLPSEPSLSSSLRRDLGHLPHGQRKLDHVSSGSRNARHMSVNEKRV